MNKKILERVIVHNIVLNKTQSTELEVLLENKPIVNKKSKRNEDYISVRCSLVTDFDKLKKDVADILQIDYYNVMLVFHEIK